MGRGGPCLNRTKAREVIDALGLIVQEADILGIWIERNVEPHGCQRWRVYTGGGIVGNSDSAWLAPGPHVTPHEKTRGPFWNKTQLTKALRDWKKWA